MAPAQLALLHRSLPVLEFAQTAPLNVVLKLLAQLLQKSLLFNLPVLLPAQLPQQMLQVPQLLMLLLVTQIMD
jgi:hypothetical protein